MEAISKKSDEQILGVLTSEQKAKMEELKGAKFEFPENMGRGGFGGPGGRGGRGGPGGPGGQNGPRT